MAVFNKLQETLQYVWEGIQRIFGPTDDEYPKTGVQPYEGEPADERDR
jgi:hypothetical protein